MGRSALTVMEEAAYIGRRALLFVEKRIHVPVTIVDARQVYGLLLLVEPDASQFWKDYNLGRMWVRAERVTLRDGEKP